MSFFATGNADPQGVMFICLPPPLLGEFRLLVTGCALLDCGDGRCSLPVSFLVTVLMTPRPLECLRVAFLHALFLESAGAARASRISASSYHMTRSVSAVAVSGPPCCEGSWVPSLVSVLACLWVAVRVGQRFARLSRTRAKTATRSH